MNVSIFDPVFSDQDRELLAQLGLKLLPENRVRLHSGLCFPPSVVVIGTRVPSPHAVKGAPYGYLC